MEIKETVKLDFSKLYGFKIAFADKKESLYAIEPKIGTPKVQSSLEYISAIEPKIGSKVIV